MINMLKKCSTCVQLVRVSSFRNDLLQNPYFSKQGFFQLVEDIFDYLVALLNNNSFHRKLNYWDALQVSAPFTFASIYIDKKGTSQKKKRLLSLEKQQYFALITPLKFIMITSEYQANSIKGLKNK